ncbi:MAG: MerR family transcriptional regulator [Candidatus Acidiferrales bacterium]
MASSASTNRPLYSGELARLAGVSPDTVRYYERSGLLPRAPRSASGYRLFPPEALNRVRVIRRALSLGLSVRDLAGVFSVRDSGGAPCRRVRKLAGEKLVELESRLRDLQSWRRELLRTIAEWDRLLARTPSGKRARLLEAFAAAHPKSSVRLTRLSGPARGNRKQEKRK